jgi:putative selenium metabolism hydrolase
MSPDVLSLARSLVRIPSPSGGEGAVAAFVAETMRGCGFSEVRVDGLGNVIGLRRGSQPGPTLLFDGHMDVVDPGSEPWAHDPYGGQVAQGRLWGRGAADTKGALAAMICAGAGLPLEDLEGTLVVAATVCEENLTGAALGHVLDACPADLVITGEPTGLRLGVAQKGRATFRLHAIGRSSHTSQPELGDNAVYKMIEAVSRLRALPLPADPELGPGVLELVELRSEPWPNQTLVPDGCHARFVARTMPGETADAFLGRITASLGGLTGVTCDLDRLRQSCYTGAVLEAVDFLPGWRCPHSGGDPWRTALLAVLAAAGLPADTYAAPCGTNASESAGRRHIPSFIYGPGTLAQAHSVDEWVAIADLHAALAGYAAIARRVIARDKHLP